MGSEAKLGAVGVKHHVLALQENITEDREANTSVRLKTTKAGAIAGGAVVHQGAGHGSSVSADSNAEIGQSSRAREDVSASVVVILSSTDLGVVLGDNGGIKKKQSGTSISNSVETSARLGSSLVAVNAEAPESLRVVNIGVYDGAGVLRGVCETKVIDTGLAVLQSNGEEGLRE